jgi:ABC-2 type transport system permease protein
LLTLAYPIITYYYFPDERILDQASLVGGYTFICVSGLLFISIGILASSLTRSQLVAGIFSFSMLFGLIVGSNELDSQAELYLNEFDKLKQLFEYAHVLEHVKDFSRGVIDSRPIVFYASGTLLMLSMAVLAVDHKH